LVVGTPPPPNKLRITNLSWGVDGAACGLRKETRAMLRGKRKGTDRISVGGKGMSPVQDKKISGKVDQKKNTSKIEREDEIYNGGGERESKTRGITRKG